MAYGKELNDDKHVFVFGSNLAGRHGKGAALEASRHWGATYGYGAGRMGNAYAIPTKGYGLRPLRLLDIMVYVEHFLNYVQAHPELTFLVTRIGCGLAGYSDAQIAPMFANEPANCVLPDEWKKNP